MGSTDLRVFLESIDMIHETNTERNADRNTSQYNRSSRFNIHNVVHEIDPYSSKARKLKWIA